MPNWSPVKYNEPVKRRSVGDYKKEIQQERMNDQAMRMNAFNMRKAEEEYARKDANRNAIRNAWGTAQMDAPYSNAPINTMEGPPSYADIETRGEQMAPDPQEVIRSLYESGNIEAAQAEETRIIDMELKKANLQKVKEDNEYLYISGGNRQGRINKRSGAYEELAPETEENKKLDVRRRMSSPAVTFEESWPVPEEVQARTGKTKWEELRRTEDYAKYYPKWLELNAEKGGIYDEREKSGMTTRFFAKPAYRRAEQMISFSGTAEMLLDDNSPIAHQSLATLLSRASGEVGNLSEADKRPFGGSQAIKDRFDQIIKSLHKGVKTETNKKYIRNVLEVFRKSGIKHMDGLGRKEADAKSRAYMRTDPETGATNYKAGFEPQELFRMFVPGGDYEKAEIFGRGKKADKTGKKIGKKYTITSVK